MKSLASTVPEYVIELVTIRVEHRLANVIPKSASLHELGNDEQGGPNGHHVRHVHRSDPDQRNDVAAFKLPPEIRLLQCVCFTN